MHSEPCDRLSANHPSPAIMQPDVLTTLCTHSVPVLPHLCLRFSTPCFRCAYHSDLLIQLDGARTCELHRVETRNMNGEHIENTGLKLVITDVTACTHCVYTKTALPPQTRSQSSAEDHMCSRRHGFCSLLPRHGFCSLLPMTIYACTAHIHIYFCVCCCFNLSNSFAGYV